MIAYYYDRAPKDTTRKWKKAHQAQQHRVMKDQIPSLYRRGV